MEPVDSCEPKTHLPQLVERVARRETMTMTRHGVPVARRAPVEAKAQPDVKRVIEEILEFRRAHPLEGEDLERMDQPGGL